MKRLQITRTHTSPYQGPNFASEEKKAVENLGLKYNSIESWDPQLETILITNTHTQLRDLDPKILNSTKLIIHPNSGYDNFSHDYDLWKNIPVVVGHKIRAQAVAEYTLSCLFEGLTELPQHLTWNKERRWDRKLLKDLTVTLFGYGHIGKIISQALSALGTKVNVVDPYISICPFPLYKTFKEVDLKQSKVIIAACGLNEKSKHMFGKDFFSAVHDELMFINGARGKLVEEKFLREFLLTHPSAFAFLDVFESEPFGHEWASFPQVWKTSHIAGVFADLDQKIIDFEIEALKSKLNDENLSGKYNYELLQNKFHEGLLI